MHALFLDPGIPQEKIRPKKRGVGREEELPDSNFRSVLGGEILSPM